MVKTDSDAQRGMHGIHTKDVWQSIRFSFMRSLNSSQIKNDKIKGGKSKEAYREKAVS